VSQLSFADLEPDPAPEQWLPIADYEGLYEVSDLGRVRSLPRETTSGLRGGKILKPQPTNNFGHLKAHLSRNSKVKQVTIHRLVLAAFVGPCPEGMEVRHLNGNAGDNRLSNLAYGTKTENVYDAIEHGTHHNASKTHCDHGHEFTPENTGERPDRPGARVCKKCQRINAVKSHQRLLERVARGEDTRKPCTTPGCERPLHAKGLCGPCYCKWRRDNAQ
jgi:HNH endonuclease/NUMOD4 motif